MILKVNSNGIYVDVSFSKDATKILDAKIAVIPKESIDIFKVLPANEEEGISEKILLRDKSGHEYDVDWQHIVSINDIQGFINLTSSGVELNQTTTLNSNELVFREIIKNLFGFD